MPTSVFTASSTNTANIDNKEKESSGPRVHIGFSQLLGKGLDPHDSYSSNDKMFTILANPSVDEMSESIAKKAKQKKRGTEYELDEHNRSKGRCYKSGYEVPKEICTPPTTSGKCGRRIWFTEEPAKSDRKAEHSAKSNRSQLKRKQSLKHTRDPSSFSKVGKGEC